MGQPVLSMLATREHITSRAVVDPQQQGLPLISSWETSWRRHGGAPRCTAAFLRLQERELREASRAHLSGRQYTEERMQQHPEW